MPRPARDRAVLLIVATALLLRVAGSICLVVAATPFAVLKTIGIGP